LPGATPHRDGRDRSTAQRRLRARRRRAGWRARVRVAYLEGGLGWGSRYEAVLKLAPEERDAAVSATALAGCGRGRDGRGFEERPKDRGGSRERHGSALSEPRYA